MHWSCCGNLKRLLGPCGMRKSQKVSIAYIYMHHGIKNVLRSKRNKCNNLLIWSIVVVPKAQYEPSKEQLSAKINLILKSSNVFVYSTIQMFQSIVFHKSYQMTKSIFGDLKFRLYDKVKQYISNQWQCLKSWWYLWHWNLSYQFQDGR